MEEKIKVSLILISGFKPFFNQTVNPSEIVVSKIQGQSQVEVVVLPVEFRKAYEDLQLAIDRLKPKAIVMLGLAGGRSQISLEKIALNWNQTQKPDESGFIPEIAKIDAQSELAIMTRFPVDLLYEFLRKHDVECEVSFSAGTFVCNNLYYHVLKNNPDIPALFVHLPYLTQQVSTGKPRMELSSMLFAIEKIIQFLLSTVLQTSK